LNRRSNLILILGVASWLLGPHRKCGWFLSDNSSNTK
jgi:hypothetical protein